MRFAKLTLSIALSALLVPTAGAGDCGCDAGCCDPCCDSCCGDGKRCELKVGKKKIKVVCYGCECDAVCLPCPSTPGCKHCENVCEGCGQCCDSCQCACDKKPVCKVRWRDWCPDGAQLYHRKKLVKYEVEKEVPDYKWVVVDCCKEGGAPAKAGEGGDKPPVPPAPKPVSAVTKRAPKGAKVGQTYDLTEAELAQITGKVRPASHVVPATRPAAQKAPVEKASAKDQLPWSLFTK